MIIIPDQDMDNNYCDSKNNYVSAYKIQQIVLLMVGV